MPVDLGVFETGYFGRKSSAANGFFFGLLQRCRFSLGGDGNPYAPFSYLNDSFSRHYEHRSHGLGIKR